MVAKSQAVQAAFVALASATAACASSDASTRLAAEQPSDPRAHASAVISALRGHPGLTVDLAPQLTLMPKARGYSLAPNPPHAGFRAAGRGFLEATLPARANQPLRIVRRGVPGFELEVTALDLADVRGEAVGGALVFAEALPGIDVVHAASDAGAEELRVLRGDDAQVALRYRLHLGASIAELRVVDGHLELLDASGYPRLQTARIVAIDARGTNRALVVEASRAGAEATVTATLDARGLVRPVVIDPMWEANGDLLGARQELSASTLLDGKVLAVGGMDFSAALSTAELYAPSSSTWSAVGAMKGRRRLHAAALLSSGRVLAAGGYDAPSSGSPLSTAEVYDPTAKTWSDAPDMAVPRAAHTTTTLASGEVLVAGGEQGSTALSSAQRYVPSTNTWKSATPMLAPRTRPTATRLPDGRVLVVGGRNATGVLSSAELYDPAADSWTSAGSMKTPRWSHTAHALPDGSVLVLGGFRDLLRSGADTAERFVPVSKSWAPIDAAMNRHRGSCFAATLGNGRVVIAGGLDFDGTSLVFRGVSQVFGAATESWTDTDSLTGGRGEGATVTLDAARALAVGGNEVGSPTTHVDLFTLQPDGASCLPAGGYEYKCANFCVDLVCCDKPCDDPCSTCASVASPGKCAPVADGPPGPPRSCGVYTRCLAGKCATTCTKDDECIASHFCSAGSCIARKPVGGTCGSSGECASRNCVDSVCCDTACDKACEACNLPGKLGECSAVLDGTTPPHDPKACSPYVCGASGCRTACTNQGHCTESARCVDGACVSRTLECSGDGLSSIDWSSGAGLATSCGGYRCGNDGRCNASCGGTGDCAPDFVCNLSARTCVAADRPRSGCALSSPSSSSSSESELSWMWTFGAAFALLRWRRR